MSPRDCRLAQARRLGCARVPPASGRRLLAPLCSVATKAPEVADYAVEERVRVCVGGCVEGVTHMHMHPHAACTLMCGVVCLGQPHAHAHAHAHAVTAAAVLHCTRVFVSRGVAALACARAHIGPQGVAGLPHRLQAERCAAAQQRNSAAAAAGHASLPPRVRVCSLAGAAARGLACVSAASCCSCCP
jgi:hypothetical protein